MDRRASVGPPQRTVRAQANLGSMMRGEKFWVPNDADAPPGAIPTTGPEGQPHDERDDDSDTERTVQEIAGHLIDVAPGTDTTGLADYINAGDHNPDGSG